VTAPDGTPGALARYYRFHARIYDATRWSFLFRRTALSAPAAPAHILEVAGTGTTWPGWPGVIRAPA
jgi:S-adenosylmethionine-diacylgycerolhomoserine-N-methlytransferase